MSSLATSSLAYNLAGVELRKRYRSLELGVLTSDPFRLDPAILPPVDETFDGPCLIEVVPWERNGRARWWRAERQGYTDILVDAGVYTAAEAHAICFDSDRSYPVDAVAALVTAERRLQTFHVLVHGTVHLMSAPAAAGSPS